MSEASSASPKIGTVLADGWIYVGRSPTTKKLMSMEPNSIKTGNLDTHLQNWFNASSHAEKLAQDGNLEARLPTAEELTYIFKEAKVSPADLGLQMEAPYQGNRYLWSSTDAPHHQAFAQAYYVGQPGNIRAPAIGLDSNLKNASALTARCVRTETFGLKT